MPKQANKEVECYFDEDAALDLMPQRIKRLPEDERPHPMDEVREKGTLVGRQDWDSGGPGAGAGAVYVYRYRNHFFTDDDVQSLGPYNTFDEAASAVGLFLETDATVSIWVKKDARRRRPPKEMRLPKRWLE
jgi:hypothetical protein